MPEFHSDLGVVPSRPATVRRRSVLALGGLAALASCGRSPSSRPSPAGQPDIPVRLSTRWYAHPEGPLPATGDEGIALTPILSGSTIPPAIVRGALIGNLPMDRPAATYLTQALGVSVTRLGARFGYGPGNDSGSIALIAWTGTSPLRGHCHMVFTPSRWIAGVLENGAVAEVASEHYPSALPQDGTPLYVDVQVRSETVTLGLPDGSTRQVSDPRFATREGVAACWEFYKNDAAAASTVFYETWAG